MGAASYRYHRFARQAQVSEKQALWQLRAEAMLDCSERANQSLRQQEWVRRREQV
jgi:hypothetical protein